MATGALAVWGAGVLGTVCCALAGMCGMFSISIGIQLQYLWDLGVGSLVLVASVLSVESPSTRHQRAGFAWGLAVGVLVDSSMWMTEISVGLPSWINVALRDTPLRGAASAVVVVLLALALKRGAGQLDRALAFHRFLFVGLQLVVLSRVVGGHYHAPLMGGWKGGHVPAFGLMMGYLTLFAAWLMLKRAGGRRAARRIREAGPQLTTFASQIETLEPKMRKLTVLQAPADDSGVVG